MQDFFLIAAAHFLALLSPGPDFFLVARSALAQGWRGAVGACLGITLANGVFIVAAFGGVAVLQPGSRLFLGCSWPAAPICCTWAGCLCAMRAAAAWKWRIRPDRAPRPGARAWAWDFSPPY